MESRLYCKTSSFLKHLTQASSIFMVLAIVAFRYQAVCNPFGTRPSIRHCNVVISMSCLFAILASSRTLYTFDSIYANVTITDNITALGRDCGLWNQDDMRLLNTVANAIEGIIVLGSVATLLILYGFIAKSIWPTGN